VIDASLILVNYRTEEHLLEALEHLARLADETPRQIIIVDNSPAAGLKGKLRSSFPRVEYLESPLNLGFAGGVNLGLARVREQFVILLNPDARPEPNCLAGLVSTLCSQEEAAVAGPRLLPFEDNQPCFPSAIRRDPDFLTALIEYTPVRSLFGRDWLQQNYFIAPDSAQQATSCAMVQGACFAVKRSWIERVGLLDSDSFFLYFEETDFCRRARLQGGKIIYRPELVCRHWGGASLDGRSQDVFHFWQSLYAFHRKHYGIRRTALLKMLLTIGLAAEYHLCRMKQKSGVAANELSPYLETVAERLAFHLGGMRHEP